MIKVELNQARIDISVEGEEILKSEVEDEHCTVNKEGEDHDEGPSAGEQPQVMPNSDELNVFGGEA